MRGVARLVRPLLDSVEMAHDGSGVDQGTLIKVQYDFSCEDGPSALFQVHRLRITEGVDEPYELDLELVSEDLAADTDLFLGSACQLEVSRGEHVRTFYGLVVAVDYAGCSEDRLFVRLRVGPAFQLLDQQTHSRLFQDASVLQILDEILGAELGPYGRTFDKGAAARGTAPRDYCVQYRETDLDFCVRLMQEEGISYHFVHDDGIGHEVLTLTYANAHFTGVRNVDGTPVVPIIAERPETADVESIQAFEYWQALTPTSLLRRDYDHATPREPLEANVQGTDRKGRNRRLYRHTDRRYIADDVAARAQDHLEVARQRGKLGRGSGNAIGFAAGKLFELDHHDREDLEGRFLITRVLHVGECPDAKLSDSQGSEATATRYRNSFHCIPFDVPLRPAQTMLKPRAHGPETAIVAGPAGEEIHVDAQGRIKVQFHWEEERTYDDTSSCWVRVRQQWSGPGWGFQFIPRVGQEVLVEFLGGDPDRPLVTGTVYNGDNTHPYPLPDQKTQSGIKTSSVAGDGSNELRFEDQAGIEEVYIHGQKDLTIATEHDESLTIGNDRTKLVRHDQRETVENDKSITVGGNHTEAIAKDMSLTVDGNRSVAIGKNHDETITGAYRQSIEKTKSVSVTQGSDESVGKDKSIHVGGSFTTTCDGAVSVSASLSTTVEAKKDATVKTDKNLVLDAGLDVTQKSGKKTIIAAGDDLAIKTDKKALISAADELTIKVGEARIVLKKNGDISINGKDLNLKGSGAVTTKGSSVDNN
jgi:type VI secretion system secreted protein VgrG